MVAILGNKLSHLFVCLLVIGYRIPLGYKPHETTGAMSILFYGSISSI